MKWEILVLWFSDKVKYRIHSELVLCSCIFDAKQKLTFKTELNTLVTLHEYTRKIE